MTERAEPSNAQLERLLEQRVAERTRELTQANAELQRQNDDWRERAEALRERELACERAERALCDRECLSRAGIDALRQSEREARQIVNGIPAGIGVLAPSGELQAINDRMRQYFGKTEAELRQWDTNGIVHADDLPRVREHVRGAITRGEAYDSEQRLLGADGAYRWFQVRAFPVRDEDGRIVRWYALHIDIDEWRRAEEALRSSEENLLKIINTLPTTAWSTRPDGFCDFLSHRWLDYAGFTAEEAVGWNWGSVIHPDDQEGLFGYWKGCLDSGAPVDCEARMRRHDGAYRWFLFRANPLRDEQGTIIKWYGTNIDIEDRKRAEVALGELNSALAHMSRTSSLGVLTASVAHEVSQPLVGIITNASTCVRMLAASPPNVEGALETARRTIRDGTRASEVVSRLRALFGKKPGKKEAVDLNEAAAEVVALAARDLQRNRVVLRMDLSNQLPQLTADRVQLQQVILNLLLNATDAMSTVNDRPRVSVIRTVPEGNGVRLSVEDAGIGFDAGVSERLFQAFYTTKSSGMGIGLSVSRSIIESHGGRLWGEPNDGPGATFSFSIPVSPR